MRFRRRARALALAAVVAAVPEARAAACTDLARAPSTRWSLMTEHGISWLVTPCGQPFFSLGVNALDGGYPDRSRDGKIWYSWTAFDPTQAQWVDTARQRLAKWGFNSAGGWSLPPQMLRLPAIIDLELGRQARFHWFDPFAPATRDADDGARAKARRPLSRQPLPDRLLLGQRGRLVGRRAVRLLFDEAGGLGDETALGRGLAPALRRRLGDVSPPIFCRLPASLPGHGCSPRPG